MRYLLVILLLGCKLDCEEKTRTVDLVPGDPTFNIQLGLLQQYQEQDWDCSYTSIRDGAGRDIGSHWTCTKCD